MLVYIFLYLAIEWLFGFISHWYLNLLLLLLCLVCISNSQVTIFKVKENLILMFARHAYVFTSLLDLYMGWSKILNRKVDILYLIFTLTYIFIWLSLHMYIESIFFFLIFNLDFDNTIKVFNVRVQLKLCYCAHFMYVISTKLNC